MKIGLFTTPNAKGQVVIPKEIRDALGITKHKTLHIQLVGKGIHIYPVDQFITTAENENSYIKLLMKTKGEWKNESTHKKSPIELAASQKRKQAW
jgi:AbrB family looped-hinge helix DNA binding protein